MKHDGNRHVTLRVALAAALGLAAAGESAWAQTAPDAQPTQDEQTPPSTPDDAQEEVTPDPAPPPPMPAAPPPPPPPPSDVTVEVPAADVSDELLLQDAEPDGEVIIVTGSRIRTDPLDKPAPVLQLTREEIERSGLTSLGDFLQRLPVSGGALNTRFNSSGNFGFPPDGGGIGAGSAQADMRYLGSKRVLVLVDGVRWVNGSSASGVPSATDLNTIPMGIVERIEVLEDGASPLYGSDAIGGVINIITKKNWEGASANAYYGGYHQGDGINQQYDLTWGQKNQRMSMIFGLSLVDQTRISSADREQARYAKPGAPNCEAGCSSATPDGRFVFRDLNSGEIVDITPYQRDVDGRARYNPDDPSRHDFKAFERSDRFNYAPYNLMLTPSLRMSTFSGVEYKLQPRLVAHARAVYTHRKSVNQAAPEPFFIGPESGNTGRLANVTIHETNPYNPFGFTLDPATNPYFIGRRPVEAGPRIYEQAVNTWYLTGGLRGDFQAGPSRVYWDTNVAYGINRADQIKHGGFNTARVEKALGPLSVCQADAECVPLDIFSGEGSITPEMLKYITFVQKDVSQQTLLDLTANASADLLKVPAGHISVAAGLEHRQQSGFYQPDAIVVAGDSSEVPSTPLSGSIDVTEGYAEVRVPLLRNMPGANLFDIGAAVRLSQYTMPDARDDDGKRVASQSTFKVGTRWRPHADLLLRGNYGQGFRAAGIGELYGAAARYDRDMTDPCSDMLGLVSGSRAPDDIIASCEALGVPTDGSYVQYNPQISVTTGGNLDLKPETSTSYTLSLVYSPSFLEKSTPWIDNIDIELTYYRVSLDKAIQALDAQVQLDRCVRTQDPLMCGGIQRTPTGVINAFANQLTNIGGIETDGIDITLGYTGPATRGGRFRVMSISSVLLSYSEIIPTSAGTETVELVGKELGDPVRAFPRLKSSLSIDWFWREMRASWTARYIHAVTEQCRGLTGLELCSAYNADDNLSTNRLAPTLYNDAQVTWTPRVLDNLLDLTVGVNNIFNQDPPVCYSCSLNGFDATTYDVPGLFGYLKAAYRMW